MRKLTLTIALAIAALSQLSGCARNPSKVQGQVHHYSLPYHIWSDPWFLIAGDMRFFDIEQIMKDYQLDRLSAVELQNFYRDEMEDIYEAKKCDHQKNYERTSYRQYFGIDTLACFSQDMRNAAWEKAVAKIKAGEREAGWNAEKLQKARFVVAFDVDNTLLWQSWDHPEQDIAYAPGYFETLEFVKNHGGAVILYTARNDPRVMRTLLPRWQVEKNGQKIAITDYVDAIFTNNHMVMAAGDYKTDAPAIIIPSKDLRIIDEKLEKAFIVDDLPSRIVQFELLRYVSRWDPRKVTAIEDGNNLINSPNRLLDAVKEIAESVEWAEANNTTPAKAFLPYSFAGRPITNQLALEKFGGDFAKAVAYVRANPAIVTHLK